MMKQGMSHWRCRCDVCTCVSAVLKVACVIVGLVRSAEWRIIAASSLCPIASHCCRHCIWRVMLHMAVAVRI